MFCSVKYLDGTRSVFDFEEIVRVSPRIGSRSCPFDSLLLPVVPELLSFGTVREFFLDTPEVASSLTEVRSVRFTSEICINSGWNICYMRLFCQEARFLKRKKPGVVGVKPRIGLDVRLVWIERTPFLPFGYFGM